MTTQYREILRLASLGLSGRSIAGSVSCSRNTVSEVLARAVKLGMEWPVPLEVGEADLRKLLFPEKEKETSSRTPDCEYIHRELAKPGVTMTLLWDEYCRKCRDGGEIPYQYSQFCKLYRKYAVVSRATMHIERKPGERMEADWAGKEMRIRDSVTGGESPAYIFVAVLPASQYAYVEAFTDVGMESWILGHTNAFAHFGGVPRMVVPDNLKTGVDKADWYSPVINKTYHEMAEYYGTAILPARVRQPRDKPSVEGTVGHVSTWIMAALRDRTFFSVPELNLEIRKKLEELNERPFQKRPGSRRSVFTGGRAGFPFSPSGETLRNSRVEAGDRLLQLPRPGGGEFLQRMPRVHQAESGRPHHEPHGGDLLQRGPNMLPPQGKRCFRTVPDGARAHAGKPPPKRRVERRALYLLGFKHRAEHGRCHPKRTCRMQGRTAGFSDMHGDPQDGGQVLRRTPGKRLCEGSFLYAPSHKQEHPGDSQIRAGQDSSVRRACQESGRPAQLHPGRGILRGWTGC